jgi:hypothetical protein
MFDVCTMQRIESIRITSYHQCISLPSWAHVFPSYLNLNSCLCFVSFGVSPKQPARFAVSIQAVEKSKMAKIMTIFDQPTLDMYLPTSSPGWKGTSVIPPPIPQTFGSLCGLLLLERGWVPAYVQIPFLP